MSLVPSFDAQDLKKAAEAASSSSFAFESPASWPASPTSPLQRPVRRVAFCPTATVFLFDRTLGGCCVPSDAVAPLGLGTLLKKLVWPLSTVEPRCPYTGRRPGPEPVPPEDRIDMLRAAEYADEVLEENSSENVRLLQELSDSRTNLIKRRHKRATAWLCEDESDEYADESDEEELARPSKCARTLPSAAAGCGSPSPAASVVDEAQSGRSQPELAHVMISPSIVS